MTQKLGFTVSLRDVQQRCDSVKNNPRSSLVVPLGKELNEIASPSSGRHETVCSKRHCYSKKSCVPGRKQSFEMEAAE